VAGAEEIETACVCVVAVWE